MLQRIRAAALALVVGAGTLVLAPSAATAAAAPTISAVDLSPAAPIVVSGGDVSVTFSFTTTDATTADLKLNGDPVAVTSAPVTGGLKWTGTKSFGPGAAGKWSYTATAHGDGDIAKSGSFDVVKALTTKIADFDAGPDLVDKGDTVKVSGRLLADAKGYDGQSVTITFRERGTDAYRHVAKVTTGRGGWFGARVRAEATGWWRAEFAATSVALGSTSDTDRVDVRHGDLGSRITGFDARPEPVDRGDRLSLSGTLKVEDGGSASGRRVAVYFKEEGTSRWEYVTSDVTDRHGRFWASAVAYDSGWWRAEFDGVRGVNGSVSGADWVHVNQPAPAPEPEKADTRLTKFNATPEPVKRGKYLMFRGVLQVDDEGSWDGYKAKVALYFKPLGSKKWKYVKSTWSNTSGRLYTKTKAAKSGTWKFVFAGDGDTYGDHSGTDYVRVKR
ncbi:hypothetical protein GCM10022224_051870 [Nonomuraea antimicrobica]|uniref:Ig-like domain (Group 3) n=1 Tax=Nonomuraea antimicrobica TaxID=561173 RepID=A0ABP7C6Q8_9ACTN